MIPLRHGHDFLHGQYAVYDIQGIERLLRAAHPVGLFRRTGRTELRVGIPHVGVLQLFRIRGGINVEHEPFRLYGMAQQSQIDGGQCLQKAHAAGAVAEAVVGFQRDAPVVVVDPDKITIVTLKGHRHTGVLDILQDVGAGSVIGLQIPPE